jgi:hypothetical protein
MVCAAALVLAACGGNDPVRVDAEQEDGSADAATTVSDGSAITTPGTPPGTTADTTVFVPVGAELFDTDFAQVCRGTGLPQASAYEPSPGVHPLVAMSSEDGVEYTGSFTTTLPDGWSVMYPDLASAELVLCETVVSTTPQELCTGYVDDENPDAGESSVQVYDVTYEISLRVATTAEVLHSETVEASDDSCPMLVFFDEDDPDPKPWNSSISDGVVELMVKPFVAPA